ncbi:MAG: hypothetical protein IJ435_00315 [Clostridia bacterium]|nr:hypothetical protein [Clostridia bacterium]
MENKETFNYTYSAKEQAEIQNIRKKYVAPEEDKMEQLRRLDRGVSKKASVKALSVGITGALVMGLGMSLAMTELGQAWGLTGAVAMALGIVVGIIGMALASVAYPVYNKTLRSERERIAPEIIRLTDELLKS